MTWTYFTADLDGSRPISKPERDELFDQLVEKFTCGRFSLLDLSAYKNGFIHDLATLRDDAGGDTLGRLSDLIEIGASDYWLNWSTVHSTALGLYFGGDAAQLAALVDSGADCVLLWNYLRYMIDHLVADTAPIFSLTDQTGSVGTAFSYTPSASPAATSWSVVGSLPPGLSISGSTGTISGTPSAAGTFSFILNATNHCGTRGHNFTFHIGLGPPPLAATFCRARSASKTKCGFAPWGGGNARYLKASFYTAETMELKNYAAVTDYACGGSCLAKDRLTYYGDCTYSRSTCSPSPGVCDYAFGVSCIYSAYDFSRDVCVAEDGTVDDILNGAGVTHSDTGLTRTFSGTGTCIPGVGSGVIVTGTVQVTLSDEYTTDQLKSDTADALGSATWGSWNNPCSGDSYTEVSSDEITVTKRELEYYFAFADMAALGVTCYKLYWQVEQYPLIGGSGTVIDSKSYQWDGSADHTPTYNLGVPPAGYGRRIINVTPTYDCA